MNIENDRTMEFMEKLKDLIGNKKWYVVTIKIYRSGLTDIVLLDEHANTMESETADLGRLYEIIGMIKNEVTNE